MDFKHAAKRARWDITSALHRLHVSISNLQSCSVELVQRPTKPRSERGSSPGDTAET